MDEDDFIQMLLSGGVFKPPGVTDEPVVTLTSWGVMEVNSGGCVTRHFVGFWQGVGRVSSPLLEWSREKQEGRTRSGRIYRLDGAPDAPLSLSRGRDVEHVRGAWLIHNGLAEDDWRDVTNEYWREQ